MNEELVKRKLSAILSADVQGYSRLMGDDEEATVRTLTAYRNVMARIVERHRGRVVDSAGDNLLAEFASVVDAAQCAVDIQQEIRDKNTLLPEHRRMLFRIGINLGDIIEEGDRIYGDGVNIAARIEGLAEGGGICISGTAYDQIENKLALPYEFMGEHAVKNISKPVRVYRVLLEDAARSAGDMARWKPPSASGVSEAPTERQGRVDLWRGIAVALGLLLLVVVAGLAVKHLLHGPQNGMMGAPGDREALSAPDKPSIAVLPFVNMSGDPQQEYFSDGMTEDLITNLAKISGLFVIARNSVFTYKGKSAKVEEVGKQLGVRYLLEGSVRKAAGRVRITAQLIDTDTGGHLWAEQYDRDLKDIFAVQDDVTQKIVKALEVKLMEEETARLTYHETDNLEAYDLTLKGWSLFREYTNQTNAQAAGMFRRAIELDPDYAVAYSGLIWTKLMAWNNGWSQDPKVLEEAFALGKKALTLNEDLPDSHALLGNVYLWRGDHDKAIAEFERAIALNPNNADAHYGLGSALVFAGEPREAIPHVERSMRLNPDYPEHYIFTLGMAYFHLNRYEDAVAVLKKSLMKNPSFLPAHYYLAASYAYLGKMDDARAEVAELLKQRTGRREVQRRQVPYKKKKDWEKLFRGLSMAGMR